MARGHDRERDLRNHLQEHGWVCVRSAGSLGPVDVVAICPCSYDDDVVGCRVMVIEVKSTAGGPYERFGPKDREEMLEIAEKAGAEPWLAWWPPCKPGQKKLDALRWIPARDWPRRQTA